MKRSYLSSLTAVLLLGTLTCLLGLPWRQSCAAAQGSPIEKKIERLIRNLGSGSFEEREAATRALKELEDAEPALRKLVKSDDLEIRRRAADILKALARKRGGRILAQALAMAKMGRAVEMADRLVFCAESDKSAEGWSAAMRLSEKVIDLIPPAPHDLQKIFRHVSGVATNGRSWFPAGDFRAWVEHCTPKPEEISGREVILQGNCRRLVRAERVSWGKKPPEGPGGSIVLASEDVHIYRAVFSLIIAGGNVEIDFLRNSIVICDGDVNLTGSIGDNVIIARGNVMSRRSIFPGSMVRSDGFIRLINRKPVAITDKTPDPFAFVKFFELADVGLTAVDRDLRDKPIRDGVFLKDVSKKSPFAAGLRAGDVIAAIDGKKTSSKEDFRRLLRRKLAEGSLAITFTVRRADKILDVAIPVKD